MSVSIEEALAQLDPKLRKRLGTGVGVNYEYQPTPSFGLNRALNGGLPYGRQVLVWGSKSSAKSSLCLQMIAEAQQDGKLCAWIDAEMSYSEDWAKRLGVDTDQLIVSQARTINEMVDVGTNLMNAGVDLIVVDSITVFPTSFAKAYMSIEEGKSYKFDFGKTKDGTVTLEDVHVG